MTKLKPLNRQFISNLKSHELETDAKRNLILSILKSTTTKREAQSYLQKYRSQFGIDTESSKNSVSNLLKKDEQRDIFIDRFLARQNPFINIYQEDKKVKKIPLRIAIFKIKAKAIVNDQYSSISETFSRLVNLGISPIVLLDYDESLNNVFKHNEQYVVNQAQKVVKLLSGREGNSMRTTVSRDLFEMKSGSVTTTDIQQILIPLYQDIIPIIQPIVFNSESSSLKFHNPDDLVSCVCDSLLKMDQLLTIEKVVFIDPIGGIPSIERNQTSHVFINLSQEYSDIVSELYIGFIEPRTREKHLANLSTVNQVLNLIHQRTGSDDTTGIITTPDIASINDDQLNPIIYNVLTDRPIISSSLPSSNNRTPQLSTSVIKKGLEMQVFEGSDYAHTFTLHNLIDENLVDKKKLLDLIEDSFGKTLNVEDYLGRIDSSLATLIILGDYYGAAIITWEQIPGSNDKVAYLDKFAIAKKFQGLPGMADVIFKGILQAHPYELIWRSRKNNPVNKWYFDRCVGSMSNPDSQWKLFFTGEVFDQKIDKTRTKKPDRVDIQKKLNFYTNIIESIPPSFHS